jgi:hypothetical protein
MKKNIFWAFFIVLIGHTLYGQNEVDSLFWPKELYNHMIVKYFENMTTSSIDDIEKAYNYVLDFLFESIISHKRNCNNYYEETTLTTYVPKYIDGKLEIVEELKIINFFNKKTNELYEKADISLLFEYFNYSSCILTYNLLIDYWFEKTNIYLRSKLNYNSLTADLWNKYMWNDENIKQKILTPEEWEEHRNKTKESYEIDL